MCLCRPKDSMRALKKRLGGNKNYREVMLALTVRSTATLKTTVPTMYHTYWATAWNVDPNDSDVLVYL